MSLYEIKTPFGVPVIARDAPRRIMPPLANLEATLAAMKADAERCNARLNGKMAYKPSTPKPAKTKPKSYADIVREQSEAAILAVFQDGMATKQIALACGLTRETTRTNLRRMEHAGLVTHQTTGTKQRAYWFRVQSGEAA
jgi:CRP-like cAMP-binding protein